MTLESNGIYSQQIKTITISNIYTHDELPESERFIDQRLPVRKILDAILAPFRNLNYVLKSVPSRILTTLKYNPYSEYCHPKQAETWNKWKQDSTGLHIFTHGFNGHPSTWNIYIKALRKTDPTADVRVPFVPEKGNCSLESATGSIRAMVNAYINEQVNKKENTIIPISLYGVSNGAKIMLNTLDGLIDQELDNRLKAKGLRLAIKLDAVAGVFRGTTYWKVRLVNSCGFTKWIARTLFRTSLEALEDFKYKSDASKKLIDTVRKVNNTANIVFKFAFYASTEDEIIKPYFSSLPVLGKNETHHIVHHEGHTSILGRVFSTVINSNKQWMSFQKQEWKKHLQIKS